MNSRRARLETPSLTSAFFRNYEQYRLRKYSTQMKRLNGSININPIKEILLEQDCIKGWGESPEIVSQILADELTDSSDDNVNLSDVDPRQKAINIQRKAARDEKERNHKNQIGIRRREKLRMLLRSKPELFAHEIIHAGRVEDDNGDGDKDPSTQRRDKWHKQKQQYLKEQNKSTNKFKDGGERSVQTGRKVLVAREEFNKRGYFLPTNKKDESLYSMHGVGKRGHLITARGDSMIFEDGRYGDRPSTDRRDGKGGDGTETPTRVRGGDNNGRSGSLVDSSSESSIGRFLPSDQEINYNQLPSDTKVRSIWNDFSMDLSMEKARRHREHREKRARHKQAKQEREEKRKQMMQMLIEKVEKGKGKFSNSRLASPTVRGTGRISERLNPTVRITSGDRPTMFYTEEDLDYADQEDNDGSSDDEEAVTTTGPQLLFYPEPVDDNYSSSDDDSDDDSESDASEIERQINESASKWLTPMKDSERTVLFGSAPKQEEPQPGPTTTETQIEVYQPPRHCIKQKNQKRKSRSKTPPPTLFNPEVHQINKHIIDDLDQFDAQDEGVTTEYLSRTGEDVEGDVQEEEEDYLNDHNGVGDAMVVAKRTIQKEENRKSESDGKKVRLNKNKNHLVMDLLDQKGRFRHPCLWQATEHIKETIDSNWPLLWLSIFEIFRRSAIWGDCRRVQIAVFVGYMWLICFVILECKISRFLFHFQRPKQNPANIRKTAFAPGSTDIRTRFLEPHRLEKIKSSFRESDYFDSLEYEIEVAESMSRGSSLLASEASSELSDATADGWSEEEGEEVEIGIRIKHSVLMGRARPIKTLCFMRIEWLKFDDYVPARITKKILGFVPFFVGSLESAVQLLGESKQWDENKKRMMKLQSDSHHQPLPIGKGHFRVNSFRS